MVRSRRSSLLDKQIKFDGKQFVPSGSSVEDENDTFGGGNTSSGQTRSRRLTFSPLARLDSTQEFSLDDDDNNDKDNNKDDDDKHTKYENQKKQRSLFRRIRINASAVDALLAASGAAGGLAALQWLSDTTGHVVFGSFLRASAVAFFFNESPPTLHTCARATLFSCVTGVWLHFVPGLCGAYTMQALLFAQLLYSKCGHPWWSGSNALFLTVAAESGGWGALVPQGVWDTGSRPFFPWRFLLLPYVSGHVLLFGMAHLLSRVRRKIRTALLIRDFAENSSWREHIVEGHERRKRLRVLFDDVDSNGDGHLDGLELQQALGAATGSVISLRDTQDILCAVDSSGNGNLDFDGFCAAIDTIWPE